jgi:hypothetical protein
MGTQRNCFMGKAIYRHILREGVEAWFYGSSFYPPSAQVIFYRGKQGHYDGIVSRIEDLDYRQVSPALFGAE